MNGLNNPQSPSVYKNQLSFVGLFQDLGYPDFIFEAQDTFKWVISYKH